MHRHRLLVFACSLLLLASVAAPRPARACVPMPDGTGVTDMDSRRAVIWIKDTTFEMIFQNQYQGSAKTFAWVIPLPGKPSVVDSPSAELISALDAHTVPIIEKRECVVPCRRGGMDAGLSNGPNGQHTGVTVWDGGQLGNMDYAVISSGKSADLIAWLNQRGFNMPKSLSALVDDYLKRGFVFFAGRVDPKSQSTISAVPPVRFTFDKAKVPMVYPMKISAFNRQSPLGTLIWVIAQKLALVPKNYPVALVSGTEFDAAGYQKALEATMQKSNGRTFVLQFAGKLTDDWKRQQLYSSFRAGKTEPPEMKELTNYSNAPTVTRLQARLTPAGVTEDLTFEATSQTEDGWFLSPCPGGVQYLPCPDSSVSPAADGGVPNPHTDGGGGGVPAEGGDETGCAMVPGRGSADSLTLLLLFGLLLYARRRLQP